VSAEIIKTPEADAEILDSNGDVQVGQWYWIRTDRPTHHYKPDDFEELPADRRSSDFDEDGNSVDPVLMLACCIEIGSNYVKLESPRHMTWRVHFDEFDLLCRREHHPDEYIGDKIKHHQQTFSALMGEVQQLTRRLAITPIANQLGQQTETQALATCGAANSDMGQYKADLAKAKDKDLPDLFKAMEEQQDKISAWMTASAIPLKVQAQKMKGTIEQVEERIHNVQLYAGLSENVVQVAKGDPADVAEPVHLMQRRLYMDEEALLDYRAGGMEFKSIRKFDTWLAKPENRDRLLPFPRCLVTFRVRRNDKDREWNGSLRDFIRIHVAENADKQTFLFVRNGDQIYRLSTTIDFGDRLFPDFDASHLTSKLWIQLSYGRLDKLVSEDEYRAILKEYEDHKREWEEAEKKDGENNSIFAPCMTNKYVPFDRSSVYYDDAAKMIREQINQHNRIVLILQGLLDRSPALHPHPPWKIWTQGGFEQAFRLVYDDSRVLVAGPKPDFEAYRAKLNASLKTGSVTVGQQDEWELHEGEKEANKRDKDYRFRNSDYRPSRWKPYGNKGPGVVAAVADYKPKAKKCVYRWQRVKLIASKYGDEETTDCTLTIDAAKVLNVDAYTPGDFRQFFADPRTRAEYLQWAPMLLTAEDYKAGKTKHVAGGCEE